MLSQNFQIQYPGLRREKVQISRLINSIYYFIEIVFILKKDDKYRLIVLHDRMVLTDSTYQTFKAAKIAFSKMYQDKAWQEDVKAEWTNFYIPDQQWLDENMEIADKSEKLHY